MFPNRLEIDPKSWNRSFHQRRASFSTGEVFFQTRGFFLDFFSDCCQRNSWSSKLRNGPEGQPPQRALHKGQTAQTRRRSNVFREHILALPRFITRKVFGRNSDPRAASRRRVRDGRAPARVRVGGSKVQQCRRGVLCASRLWGNLTRCEVRATVRAHAHAHAAADWCCRP